MYTAFVVRLRVSKESKACQILPIITFVCCSSFPVLLFSSFSSLGKRYQITDVRSHVDQHRVLFCWRIWSFLLLPERTCRTWTILWTERLLSKSGYGMATQELTEVDNDDNVVDIINCVALLRKSSLLAEVSHDEAKMRERRETLLSLIFASSWETSASRETKKVPVGVRFFRKKNLELLFQGKWRP